MIAPKEQGLIIVLFLGLMEAEYLKNGEPTSYWLGGKFDYSKNEWEWSDGSTCMFFSC